MFTKVVVMISSYLPEVLVLADLILVSRQGKIVEKFTNVDVIEQDIMYADPLAAGEKPQMAAPLPSTACTATAAGASPETAAR